MKRRLVVSCLLLATALCLNAAPVKLTMLTGDFVNAALKSDIPVMQELTKRTGVEMQFDLVPQTDLQQKIEMGIAAKSLPDIVGVGDVQSKWNSMNMFLQLNDYYKGSASFQNLFKKFNGLEKNIKDDSGNFWFIPQLTERTFRINEMINQDLLDRIKMKAPSNVTEFETVLKAFKALGPDVIPWGRSPWAGWEDTMLCAFDTTKGWFDFGGGRYEYGPYDRKDNFKRYLTFINKLFSEGLIDRQMITISDDDSIAKLRTNKVGFMYGWADGFANWGKNGSYGTAFVPMGPIAGPDGKKHCINTSYLSGMYFYLNNRSKNSADLLKWIDYIYSDDGITLLNWGIEGLTYTVKGGKKAYTDIVMKDPKVIPVNQRRTFGMSPPDFPHFWTNDAEGAVVGDLTASYEGLTKGAGYPVQPILTGTAAEEKKLSGIMNDINKYVDETLPKFYTGALSVDKDFDKFIDQLKKLGIEDAKAIQDAKFQRWQKR